MFKQGDLVVTSKNRYGKIVDKKDDLYLVKIGSKNHWIYENQLVLNQDSVRFKIEYETTYISNIIKDSIELTFKKSTVLQDNKTSFIDVVSEKLNNVLKLKVKINKISIS